MTNVDPVGRPIAVNTTVCQGGTTCVATGQDRRLGDYLTVVPDLNGCLMIATGDVTQPDPASGQPRQTSLPLFARQNSGTSLFGGTCGVPERPPGAATGKTPFAQGPGGVTASCNDRIAPRSRFGKGTRVRHRRLRLRGASSDRGCSNPTAHVSVQGKVQRVWDSIARERGRRCAYLLASGKFTRTRSGLRTSYIRARGTTRWALDVRRRLPRGRYKVWVRGIDVRGNVERKNRKRNFHRFRVR
jgi:hypothetical protein